jgi:GDPmannose 4,6-dehydratase
MIILDRLKEARAHPNFHILYGDVTDISSIMHLFQTALRDPMVDDGPLEVYNLAAQSHVKVSFETPIYTSNADAVGVLNVLETIMSLNIHKRVRLYQASTSELYGSSPAPQSEVTPFQPRSPYAIAKLYAYWIVRNYREAYGMFAVNGILFNHESERRGETFVSRKITRAVAEHYHNKGGNAVLTLGNMNALRDWGHARDYVEMMWRMLQYDIPDDFVIGTGESHTVKEFVEAAFSAINIRIRWEGSDENEKGYDAISGALLVQVDPKYYRLTEVNHLCGDITKARTVLHWEPRMTFAKLVRRMVQYDIDVYKP